MDLFLFFFFLRKFSSEQDAPKRQRQGEGKGTSPFFFKQQGSQQQLLSSFSSSQPPSQFGDTKVSESLWCNKNHYDHYFVCWMASNLYIQGPGSLRGRSQSCHLLTPTAASQPPFNLRSAAGRYLKSYGGMSVA